MAKYIDADEFARLKREWYCDQCEKRKGMKRGRLQFVYCIGGPPCRACDVDDMISDIEDFPAADVELKQRWIPVSERLPERGVRVLTAIYGTDLIVEEEGESLQDAVRRARSGPCRIEEGYLDADGIWTEYVFGAPMIVHPRYWMPIPEMPEEGNHEDGGSDGDGGTV